MSKIIRVRVASVSLSGLRIDQAGALRQALVRQTRAAIQASPAAPAGSSDPVDKAAGEIAARIGRRIGR